MGWFFIYFFLVFVAGGLLILGILCSLDYWKDRKIKPIYITNRDRRFKQLGSPGLGHIIEVGMMSKQRGLFQLVAIDGVEDPEVRWYTYQFLRYKLAIVDSEYPMLGTWGRRRK